MESIIDWVTVITAATAAITSIASLVVTNRFQSEQLSQQRKIEQSKIDADLKAKARIEWIAAVKKQTTEYISAVEELLELVRIIKILGGGKQDVQYLSTIFRSVFDSGNLLILQFGPDSDSQFYISANQSVGTDEHSILEYTQVVKQLLKMDSTDGVNEKVVLIIEYMLVRVRAATQQLADTEVSLQEIADYFSGLGESYPKDIRDCIRRYLKIEWDKAKSGK